MSYTEEPAFTTRPTLTGTFGMSASTHWTATATAQAVLERGGNPEALPVVEITTPEGSWYDYEHRYTEGLADHIMPAPLPEEQYSRTQEIAVLAFESLGCRDLSRADFVVPERGEPIILEVNTMPGMTPTSLFPDAVREAGISFEELVALLVERAVSRKS